MFQRLRNSPGTASRVIVQKGLADTFINTTTPSLLRLITRDQLLCGSYLSDKLLQQGRRVVLLPDQVECECDIHIHDWK
jgi:hypothetical protein